MLLCLVVMTEQVTINISLGQKRSSAQSSTYSTLALQKDSCLSTFLPTY